MKNVLTLLLSFLVMTSYSQESEELLSSNYGKVDKGKITNKYPKVTLRIDSLEIGNRKYDSNLHFVGRIKTQSGLLQLNDSIAINIIFLKLKILNKQEFIYSQTFYKKGSDAGWEAVSPIQFYTFIPGSYTDGWGGYGNRGETDSFWYKMYCKFE